MCIKLAWNGLGVMRSVFCILFCFCFTRYGNAIKGLTGRTFVGFYDKEEEGDKLALDDDNDVCIRYFLLYWQEYGNAMKGLTGWTIVRFWLVNKTCGEWGTVPRWCTGQVSLFAFPSLVFFRLQSFHIHIQIQERRNTNTKTNKYKHKN